jgi:hypothetical protein
MGMANSVVATFMSKNSRNASSSGKNAISLRNAGGRRTRAARNASRWAGARLKQTEPNSLGRDLV